MPQPRWGWRCLRLEVGGVTPELVLLKRLGVMQPHHQRGVNLVEETVETIAHERGRMAHQFGPLASIVAGEDQHCARVRVFA